jgi:hypothetical protein
MGLVKQKIVQLAERGKPKDEQEYNELAAALETEMLPAGARQHARSSTARTLPQRW